jgi:HEAT repeat protein
MSRALPLLLLVLPAAGCGGIAPDLDGREPYARYLAVRELAETPDAPSMARVVAALDDPHPLVTTGALETLAALGRPEFLQHAVPRLQHASPMVRRQACATIAAIRNPDGLAFLLKSFRDPEPGVRRGAFQAAASFGSRPETVKGLLEGLDEKDASTRMAAHEALKVATGKTAPLRTRESWEETLK